MTNKEIANLLNYIASVKNWHPDEPKTIMSAWLNAFGGYEASKVYMATRYVLEHSPYIPQIADVRKALNKGELLYGVPPEAPRITTNKIKREACTGYTICPYYEADLCGATPEEAKVCHI